MGFGPIGRQASCDCVKGLCVPWHDNWISKPSSLKVAAVAKSTCIAAYSVEGYALQLLDSINQYKPVAYMNGHDHTLSLGVPPANK